MLCNMNARFLSNGLHNILSQFTKSRSKGQIKKNAGVDVLTPCKIIRLAHSFQGNAPNKIVMFKSVSHRQKLNSEKHTLAHRSMY